MEELKITRYELFIFAHKQSLKQNLQVISEMYKMSAETIKGMEEQLLNKNKKDEDEKSSYDFRIILYDNLNVIRESYNNISYVNFINDEFDKKAEKSPKLTYIKCFYYLLEVISGYQNNIMDSYFKKQNPYILDYYKINSSQKPQVYLSYAYMDKGITLALYYYFNFKGIYLFIDWMHNDIIDDGMKLKNTLEENLKASKQLLLLRTRNSELRIQGGSRIIRQWCAWELGCFFNVAKDEKYYLDFYGNDGVKNESKKNSSLDSLKKDDVKKESKKNSFLDSLKKMDGIANGLIWGTSK